MAQNTSPIFVLTPNIGTATITSSTTANTKSDGTGTIGTDILKAFTAGSNGAYVSSIRFNPNASSASTATAATTLRVFISNKTSGGTTNTDTWLFQEIAAAAQTADVSTTATYYLEIPINRIIPASYTILVSTHVAANANTTWQAVVFGGDY
jgi:hypothetical protein